MITFFFFSCFIQLAFAHFGNNWVRLTTPFTAHHCLLTLFTTHVRCKFEFASVVWNSISSTESETIENMRKRFVQIITTDVSVADIMLDIVLF